MNQSKFNQQTNRHIFQYFLKQKNWNKGKNIIHMEVGEPDFLPPTIVKNALEEVFDKGFLKYGQAWGCQFLEMH